MTINIFIDSATNFIIYVIPPIVPEFFHHVSPHVAPRELWLKSLIMGLNKSIRTLYHARLYIYCIYFVAFEGFLLGR